MSKKIDLNIKKIFKTIRAGLYNGFLDLKVFLFKELNATIKLIAAIIIGVIVIPFGLVYAFIKPFRDNKKAKRNEWQSFVWFYKYWINVFLQILKVIAYFFERSIITLRIIFFEGRLWGGIKHLQLSLALTIDIFGNVTSGELIEDIITYKEYTYFGDGRFTISAATGYLEFNGWLNKRGIWFTNVLSYWFEENHSINAYLHEINKCHDQY